MKIAETTEAELLARFRSAPVKGNRLDHLRAVSQLSLVEGCAVECGVFKGESIRVLAEQLPGRQVFGFDSFQGLPKPWVKSRQNTYGVEVFKVDELPEVPSNVTLVPGWFSDTLGEWLAQADQGIALLNVDCDLYESTMTVLTQLESGLLPGTVVLFDELCDWNETQGYPKWRDGEWKALLEWGRGLDKDIEILSRSNELQAAIRIGDAT